MSALPSELTPQLLSDFDAGQRRTEPRFSVDQEGLLLVRGGKPQRTPVRIRNISSSGMQIEAPCSVPLGSRVRIHWRGHIIDGEVCNEAPLDDRFQLGVRLFAPWELLVKEVLASQSEELSIAKTELEQRNRSLAAALETARDAAAVKSRFLASVSHELRTPLNGIIGFAQMLFDGKLGGVSESQRECLGEVLGCSRHLLRLVNDLLDMARIEAGRFEFRFETVRVAQIIEQATDELRPLLEGKALRVEVRCDPTLGPVIADPTRLRQVLYNYLSNAVRFTPVEGRIAIRLLRHGENAYRIEVEDDGPGIRDSDVPRLFSEFGQLENCGAGGSGLGLALTKRIVEAQGGTVGVRSNFGEGSTFFAVLPIASHVCNIGRPD